MMRRRWISVRWMSRTQQRNYGREAYEEDEEGPRSGMQCQTQWLYTMISSVVEPVGFCCEMFWMFLFLIKFWFLSNAQQIVHIKFKNGKTNPFVCFFPETRTCNWGACISHFNCAPKVINCMLLLLSHSLLFTYTSEDNQRAKDLFSLKSWKDYLYAFCEGNFSHDKHFIISQ